MRIVIDVDGQAQAGQRGEESPVDPGVPEATAAQPRGVEAEDAGPSTVGTGAPSSPQIGGGLQGAGQDEAQDGGPPPSWLVEEIDRARAAALAGSAGEADGGDEQDGGAGPASGEETEEP